jgi:hypothetical protein
MSDSPELRAIASTYLSEGAEVAYQLAFERMRALEAQVAEAEKQEMAARRRSGEAQGEILILRSELTAMREAGVLMQGILRRLREDDHVPTSLIEDTDEALHEWRKAAGDSLNNGKSYSTEGGER